MNDVLTKAICHYGKINQVVKAIEELGELIVELSKADDKNLIADEIADVEIMLAQCKIMFDIENQVQVRKNYKIDRLRQRMGAV